MNQEFVKVIPCLRENKQKYIILIYCRAKQTFCVLAHSRLCLCQSPDKPRFDFLPEAPFTIWTSFTSQLQLLFFFLSLWEEHLVHATAWTLGKLKSVFFRTSITGVKLIAVVQNPVQWPWVKLKYSSWLVSDFFFSSSLAWTTFPPTPPCY